MDGARPGDRSIPTQPSNEPIAAAASTNNTASASSIANNTDAPNQGQSNSVTSATQDDTVA
ncbi:hypothetical protein BGX28_009498, partial [Mortierella sp. GBA30]